MKIHSRDVKIKGWLPRIAHIDGDKYTFPQDPEEFVSDLRKYGSRIDLFSFLQKLPETSPKYDYPFEWDNLAVLPVSTFDCWWQHQLRSYARNRARQAEKKGVKFREVPFGDALLQGICEVYNETPIRQGKRFPHYGMTLESARAYAGTFPDRSVYLGAFLEDRMIGFIKLVTDETRTHACIVHILSMVQHRDKAPTNGLIAEAVRFCASRQISYLVYENFSYGKREGDTLSHFKEVNGFQRMDLPRYYIPLNFVGKVALKLGLHRPLIDRVPETWLAKFRELRAAWYGRRFQTAKVVS